MTACVPSAQLTESSRADETRVKHLLATLEQRDSQFNECSKTIEELENQLQQSQANAAVSSYKSTLFPKNSNVPPTRIKAKEERIKELRGSLAMATEALSMEKSDLKEMCTRSLQRMAAAEALAEQVRRRPRLPSIEWIVITQVFFASQALLQRVAAEERLSLAQVAFETRQAESEEASGQRLAELQDRFNLSQSEAQGYLQGLQQVNEPFTH